MTGFYNILKPSGCTSSQVVTKVKKILTAYSGEKHNTVGHMGTLDPGGAGVLPVATGRATRLFDYLLDKRKTYRAAFAFSTTTDTLDSYGKVTAHSDRTVSSEEIAAVLPSLTGVVDQIPPIYSAKSIGGVKAYRLARAGEELSMKPRRVEIHRIDIVEQISENVFVFDIECGGGTYVRSICRDMAEKLGTVGYMAFIIRTKCGNLDIADSHTTDELSENPEKFLIPVDKILELESVVPTEKEYFRLVNGLCVDCDRGDGLYYVRHDGIITGIACAETGKLKFRTRLL